MKFEDFEREMKEPKQSNNLRHLLLHHNRQAEAPEPQVPPLPDTPQPTVSPVNVTNLSECNTGLTDARKCLL